MGEILNRLHSTMYPWAPEYDLLSSTNAKDLIKKLLIRAPEMRMTAMNALDQPFLREENSSARKAVSLRSWEGLMEVEKLLVSREKEDYVAASLVFRTFDEDEFESGESSDE